MDNDKRNGNAKIYNSRNKCHCHWCIGEWIETLEACHDGLVSSRWTSGRLDGDGGRSYPVRVRVNTKLLSFQGAMLSVGARPFGKDRGF